MPILRVSGLRLLCVTAVASIAAACTSTPPGPAAPAPAPPPPAAPKAADVNGTWEFSVESPMGTRSNETIFTQSGEALSGKMVSPRGEVPLTGTVKADAINFTVNLNVQGQSLQIDYSGTVTGDTMGGTVQFGSFGDGKWSGKRKQ